MSQIINRMADKQTSTVRRTWLTRSPEGRIE
jgi:hypothetical protein